MINDVSRISFDAEACSHGTVEEYSGRLNEILGELRASEAQMTLRPCGETEEVVSFYLDVAGFPEWKALCLDRQRCLSVIEPGFLVDVDQNE